MKSFILMLFTFTFVLYTDYHLNQTQIQEEIKLQQIQKVQKELQLKQEKKAELQEKKLRETNSKKAHNQPSVSQKKKHFFSLVVPAIENIHKEQLENFLAVKQELSTGTISPKIIKLKKLYRVTTNEALLLALKPHPQSIVIAQAAIESAWGTSRFFREANNIFGMWSKDPNEPRIAAGVKRAGKRTIWLRKFNNLDESIRQYYQTIGRVKQYQAFRELRYKTDDVTKLVKKLDKYSELGDEYTRILASVIRHNNLTRYDK